MIIANLLSRVVAMRTVCEGDHSSTALTLAHEATLCLEWTVGRWDAQHRAADSVAQQLPGVIVVRLRCRDNAVFYV